MELVRASITIETQMFSSFFFLSRSVYLIDPAHLDTLQTQLLNKSYVW
jgi:hypothetical protein